MSPITGPFCRHFETTRRCALATLVSVNLRPTSPWFAAALPAGLWLAAACSAHAQPNPADVQRALLLAEMAASSRNPTTARVRVEVQAQPLDSRLKLAACQRAEPFLAAGAPVWGRTRVGLRCTQGAVLWTVYLPVTVRMWAAAWAPASALPAGGVLGTEQLVLTEADWAAVPVSANAATAPTATLAATPFLTAAELAGRTLNRAVAAGQALRASDLAPRRWFAAGDTVSIGAASLGFAIGTQGQALSAGIEGQPVQVRTEYGRVLSGRATAERRVEVVL